MLVLDSRGIGAVRQGLLGSVTTAVLRHADCPVAVIHYRQSADPLAPRRPVVVGVDGSTNAMPALAVAFEVQLLRGESLLEHRRGLCDKVAGDSAIARIHA